MATLSIATRLVDGIIIWHKIDSHVVQDYLNYRENRSYLNAIYVMEQLQIAYEKNTLVKIVLSVGITLVILYLMKMIREKHRLRKNR